MRLRWLTPLSLLFLFLSLLFFLMACSQEEVITGSSTSSISTLTVVVRDETGQPLPEARVYLNQEFKGKTSKYGSSAGTQTLVLTSKENKVVVRKEGYADSLPVTVSATPGEQSVTLILERKRAVYLVSVEQDNRPVKGVRVTLFPEGSSIPRAVEETDQHGDAFFFDVPDGTYIITLSKAGYEIQRWKREIDYNKKGEFASSVFELEPRAGLQVEVRDLQGTTLSNAEVVLYTLADYNEPGTALPLAVEYTSREGTAEFTSVGYGNTYVVQVKKAGYDAETVEVELYADNRVVQVELSR